MTILFAGISAVLGMLALNGLPMPYHPVFNVPRFALASKDRFFLIVFSSDKKYDPDGTRQFLEGLAPTLGLGGPQLDAPPKNCSAPSCQGQRAIGVRSSEARQSDVSAVALIAAIALWSGCRIDMHVQPKQNPLSPSDFYRRPALRASASGRHRRPRPIA